MFRTDYRRSSLALALAALSWSLACTPQPPPPDPAAEAKAAQAATDAAKAAIDEIRTKYLNAENAGDAAAVAALYADDGVYMAPNTPAATGKAAIQAAYEQMLAQMPMQVSASPASVDVAGDRAIERGSYKTTMTPKTGKPIEDTGNYVVVSRNTDAGWKVQFLIWNSDKPPAGAPK